MYVIVIKYLTSYEKYTKCQIIVSFLNYLKLIFDKRVAHTYFKSENYLYSN